MNQRDFSQRLIPVLSALALAGAVHAQAPSGPEKGGGQVPSSTKTDSIPAPVVDGNTRFALDLYSRLRTGEGNLFLSPYSISTALAMTYAGARGETARQMASALHFPADPHAGFKALISQINGDSSEKSKPQPIELVTANALWGQQGDPFLPAFTARTLGAFLEKRNAFRAGEPALRAQQADLLVLEGMLALEQGDTSAARASFAEAEELGAGVPFAGAPIAARYLGKLNARR